MSFKNILAYLDAGQHCSVLIDAAVLFAASHRAHLTGLFVRPRSQLPDFIMAHLGPEVVELQRRLIQEQAVAVERMFRASAERVGLAVEWRVVEGDPLGVATAHARTVDLVILGQAGAPKEQGEASVAFVDHLVLGAGRPVLVIPHSGTFPVIGTRVLVAWNACREAARAVNDALPILECAQHVSILALTSPEGERGAGDVASADICLHLARHGVTAEVVHVSVAAGAMGGGLLSRATDDACDLLVMGAWGRPSLRRLVLGRTTRHLLRHMTLPVLMAR